MKKTIGKILMTIAALSYGFIPPVADFNPTHVFNPLCTAHAKFHVVWQVFITFALSILGLCLLWMKKAEKDFSLNRDPLPAGHDYEMIKDSQSFIALKHQAARCRIWSMKR